MSNVSPGDIIKIREVDYQVGDTDSPSTMINSVGSGLKGTSSSNASDQVTHRSEW